MKQHTLTRAYLDGFTDPRTPAGEKPYVWVHDGEQPGWRARAPAKACLAVDYYSFIDANGVIRHDAERALGVIEGNVAPVLRKLARREPLSPEEQGHLALFVATTMWRTPLVHDQASPLLGDTLRKMAEKNWRECRSDPEALARMESEVSQKAGLPVNLEETMKMALDPVHFDIVPERHVVVAVSLLTALNCAAMPLIRMGWRILVATAPDYFVTSDLPVSLVDPSRPEQGFQGGFACPGVDLTFPLSRTMALFAAFELPDKRYEVADVDDVVHVNERTIRHARTIIAPSTAFPGADLFKSHAAKTPLAGDGRPKQARRKGTGRQRSSGA